MGLFQSRPAAPALGYYAVPPSPPSSTGGIGRTVLTVVGAILLLMLGLGFYNYLNDRSGLPAAFGTSMSSGDVTPSPVDGKTKTVIAAADIPLNAGGDYGIQYWMFIADWDYKFGQEKSVLHRASPLNAAIQNPSISLHPTDNSLNVRVNVFSNEGSAAAAVPGADTTGDSFTCTVENVPLQTWFSVSTTIFQRNLDIYINGRLVKSCVLPGVPKPASGDMVIGDNGGFSGSVCNVHSYGNMLSPDDAKTFFQAGTNCAPPSPVSTAPVDKDSFLMKLFGYAFRFTTLNKEGKEVRSVTF